MQEDRHFVRVGDAVKYLRYGRTRHVGTVKILQSYEVAEPIRQVDADDLANLKPGPLVPLRYSADDWLERNARTAMDMRDLLVSVASGKGIEIGAGPHALRFPLGCDVAYVDAFDSTLQLERTWHGHTAEHLVPVDFNTSFEELAPFADGSLDFVAASHVIEHSRNPIRAIVTAHRKLAAGGFLFLVVPDKRYMFDQARELTSVGHLFEDFERPCEERDFEHYIDFYRIAARDPDYMDKARHAFEHKLDVHFHVWTMPTFYRFIQAISAAGLTQWREVWWCPRVAGDDLAMEFYFALRK